MYCRSCGKEMSDQFTFCGVCGSPLEASPKKKTIGWVDVLGIIIGILFVIGGFLHWLIPGLMGNISTEYVGTFGTTALQAAMSLKSFIIDFSPFGFSTAMLSIYMGMLLLRREKKTVWPMIICTVTHVASILYLIVTRLAIYFAPRFVFSLYYADETTIEECAEIIKTNPDIWQIYRIEAIGLIVGSGLLVGLAAIYLIIKIVFMKNTEKVQESYSSTGCITMILSVAVLEIACPMVSKMITGRIFGTNILSGYIIANSVFNSGAVFAVGFLFMLVLGLAVMFPMVKRGLLAMPVIGMIGLFGLLAIFSSEGTLMQARVPAELLDMVCSNFRGFIIGSMLFLIAMFYWFTASFKNEMPIWMQFTLPLLLPFIYAIVEVLAAAILHTELTAFFGVASIALVTLGGTFVAASMQKAEN